MKAWQANIVGAGVAGLVVGGGLFVGAPDVEAAGPSNPVRLVAPPVSGHGVMEVPVGEALEMWGQPSRLNVFWTLDSVDEVARTYVDAWKTAGFDPRQKKVDQVTNVSAIDKSTGLMRGVTIIDSGDERIVLPGLTDIRVAPDTTPANAPVPVPSNATRYLANVADDTTTVSYSASYLVPMSAERTLDFYRLEMGKLGYTPKKNADVSHIRSGSAAEFERGAEWVQVIADEPDAKKIEEARKSGLLEKDDVLGKAAHVFVTHVRQIMEEPAKGAKP